MPKNKRIQVALTYIFGVGVSLSRTMLKATGIDPNVKVKDLDDLEVSKLREYIEKNITVEGDLRTEKHQSIKRLMDIGCYRGLRHRKSLPVRGQRTRTNAKTRRGKAGMMGINKKSS